MANGMGLFEEADLLEVLEILYLFEFLHPMRYGFAVLSFNGWKVTLRSFYCFSHF